jgi:hypothetical protein
MPTLRDVTHNITAVDNVKSIRIIESYNTPVSQLVIEGDDTTLSLGDSFSAQIGYSGDSGKVFEGYVRDISYSSLERSTTVVCEDILSKAVDYYIAADDPENPFSRENVSTGTLVGDILNEAGISSISTNLPLSVTWATNGPLEINLITAWAAAKSIVDMMAWHLYADRNGTVHLVDRKPYIMAGDTADYTWTTSSHNLVAFDYNKSTENLRNKVVVYGKNNISRSASASSPYLPAGFYKTAVIATPFLDTGGNCQKAADFNLELFNRLTESVNVSIEGDWEVTAREIANVTESYTGISGDWFIYRIEHIIDNSGFVQNMTLTR